MRSRVHCDPHSMAIKTEVIHQVTQVTQEHQQGGLRERRREVLTVPASWTTQLVPTKTHGIHIEQQCQSEKKCFERCQAEEEVTAEEVVAMVGVEVQVKHPEDPQMIVTITTKQKRWSLHCIVLE